MFSFGLVSLASCAEPRVRLKIFEIPDGIFKRGRPLSGRGINAGDWRFENIRTHPLFVQPSFSCAPNSLVIFLSLIAVHGSYSAAVIVEKSSRQMPYVEVFGCQGVHSFIFRGPTGTSRAADPGSAARILDRAGSRPLQIRSALFERQCLLAAGHAGGLRALQRRRHISIDRSGRARQPESDDSKTIQPVVHHRHTIAQVAAKRSRKTHRAGSETAQASSLRSDSAQR